MEFLGNQAIYLQIADIICENILLGKWKEGERIPSIREIAVEMQVNPNTTVRTFNYLQEKGVIYNKRGMGYFVVEDGYKKTLALKKEEFMKKDVAVFFKNLQLLKVDINEVINLYNNFKTKEI